MLLKFLGRGSAFNVKEGNNSAFVKVNDELVLLDCGESIFEKIVNIKLLDDIKKVNVFITHLHSDHVGSLSSLIYYCYYIKKIPVDVHFPTNEIVELLNIYGHNEGREYRYVKLNIDELISIDSIKIQAIKVRHEDKLSCYGYLISISDKLIWYSGDTNKVCDVINTHNVDEIYHDTCLAEYEGNGHTSLRVLSESIPENDRSKVYCMHIDCDDLLEKAKALGFNVACLV